MQRYGDIAFTDLVRARQETDGSRALYARHEGEPAPQQIDDDVAAFLTSADSCYLASVTETGWPYIQHRGGPSGFVHVIDDVTIGWLERPGNRQFITAGNLDHDDRVAIFVMDYPHRARLKLFGRATRIERPDAALVEQLGGGRHDTAMLIRIEGWDWNCSKHITQRFDADMVRSVVEPLQRRIAELEAELASLRTDA